MTRIQQKNKPKSIKDRKRRLSELSKYNRDALSAMTVNELRELGAWLVPNARRLKKAEFIEVLIKISEKFNEEKQDEINEKLAHFATSEVSENLLIEQFAGGKLPHQTATLIDYLWRNPHSQYKKRPKESTLSKTKPKQLRGLIQAIIMDNPNMIEWCDELYVEVKKLIQHEQKQVNRHYKKETRENYGNDETTRIVSCTLVLEWAETTIKNMVSRQELRRGEWYLLSFALSLTSGRRMAELHGISEFPDNPLFYELRKDKIFISQLAKSIEGKSLVFKTLIDSELWMNGYKLLPIETKNQPNESVVNKKFSRNIAKSPKFRQALLELNLTQYKDARDFYISYMKQVECQDTDYGSSVAFARDAIGHTNKETSLSYDKFKLIP